MARYGSYGSNAVLATVSRHPGQFGANNPDVLCRSFGIISSTGFPSGLPCLLSDEPTAVYYLNFALTPGDDCNGTMNSYCPAAWTLYRQ